MAPLSDKILMSFPLKPVLTEANLPDQKGKVFIVTGSSGDIGKTLAAIVYGKNSVVYMAASSKAKSEAAIDEIRRGQRRPRATTCSRGTNSLGPLLFTKLLYPLLASTAAIGPKQGASTRVIWVSSSGAQSAPSPPMDFDNIDYRVHDKSPFTKHFRSKAGNIFLAREMARRSEEARDGVICVVRTRESNLPQTKTPWSSDR
ncbi:hypothetical protein MAPG_01306 [Magnaporthiopsis poae ATCC 64411]|uniref:Uncharacterized protein n=1 Tax=Magnaporthiopsis poae (strain ATCC 64411 / 73-15) TaxID=644358 RepID=A0A0C4DNC5_MAGP6|nr:hypothetical protein MAPG_01306 [Magnaporthiopsis poae ATCC 64411]